MTKKSYAAIKSAQEVLAKIQALADEAAHKPTTACKNAKEINALATKWNNDFADCDPAWQAPPRPTTDTRATAMALSTFGQTA